jgi:predicted alpha/beta-hydrolase family hydrolase
MPTTLRRNEVALDIETPAGAARLTWFPAGSAVPAGRSGVLLLGHGAGGGINAPDLLRVCRVAADAGLAVGLVEQPYRVAGKRAPAAAPQLDAAFVAVASAARKALRRKKNQTAPLIVGGRSSGARVACRTAQLVGAAGVLALAFPLQPPTRRTGYEPPSRLPELAGAGVPVLVIQGDRDAFGSAARLREGVASARIDDVTIATAAGADHSLRKGIDPILLSTWLSRFLP